MTTKGPDRPSAPRHAVEGPKITDAIYQAFPNHPTPVGIDPSDGLPRMAVTHPYQDAQAPELTHESMVCMADVSAFVRRNQWGEVAETHAPSAVERTPDGRYRLRTDQGAVEPIRPQCEHYRRQYVPFPDDPEHPLVIRLCVARRTDEGEFVDVGNAAIYACELRSPVYGCGVEKIDAADEAIMARQQQKKALEVEDDFDVTTALEADR